MFFLRPVVALSFVLSAGCSASDDADDLSHEGDSASHSECPEGEGQSPIDLPHDLAKDDLPDVVPEYGESGVSIINNGLTVEYRYAPGGVLRVGEVEYPLVQFHFHAHSEHAIGGEHTPLELHLVHKDADGQLLVAGVQLEIGAPNLTLEQAAWSSLPGAPDETYEDAKRRFSADALIPGGPTYRYTGSLTAPPCSGGVSWLVFERRLTLSEEQLERFTVLYDDNRREVQPVDSHGVTFGELRSSLLQ